jgi:hypothetical protein
MSKKISVALFTVLFYGQRCESAQTDENMEKNANAKSYPPQIRELLCQSFRRRQSAITPYALNCEGRAPGKVCDVFAVYSESVSVALLLAVFGSNTLFGEVTVTLSEIEPLADPLIVPMAL